MLEEYSGLISKWMEGVQHPELKSRASKGAASALPLSAISPPSGESVPACPCQCLFLRAPGCTQWILPAGSFSEIHRPLACCPPSVTTQMVDEAGPCFLSISGMGGGISDFLHFQSQGRLLAVVFV